MERGRKRRREQIHCSRKIQSCTGTNTSPMNRRHKHNSGVPWILPEHGANQCAIFPFLHSSHCDIDPIVLINHENCQKRKVFLINLRQTGIFSDQTHQMFDNVRPIPRCVDAQTRNATAQQRVEEPIPISFYIFPPHPPKNNSYTPRLLQMHNGAVCGCD